MNRLIKCFGLLLAISFAAALSAGNEKIGSILAVKGSVEARDLNTGKKYLIKKGQNLYANIMIKTAKGAQVLLGFNNGIQRLILANSEFMLKSVPGKTLEDQTLEEIQKMMTVGGVKASSQEKKMVWKDGGEQEAKQAETEKSVIQRVKTYFSGKKYYEIFLEIEKNPGLEKNTKLSPLIGFTYLKLGLGEKSKAIFESMQDSELSSLGLFLSWIEMGNTEEARKIYLTLSPSADYYKKLGELVEPK